MQRTFGKLRQFARFFSTSSSSSGDVCPSTSTVTCPHAKKANPVPSYFDEKDENKLFELIDKNSFAVAIMTNDDGTIQLCHAPFHVERKTRTMIGHLAKRNPMYDLISQKRPITLVFQGPHSYISPQFMVDPYYRVPTWNYCYAHIHGIPEVTSDEELIRILDTMASTYEANSPNAWQLKAMNQPKLRAMAQQIFGVRVKIDRVEGDFEFGLDTDEDKPGVLKGLKNRGKDYDHSLVEYMSKHWNMKV